MSGEKPKAQVTNINAVESFLEKIIPRCPDFLDIPSLYLNSVRRDKSLAIGFNLVYLNVGVDLIGEKPNASVTYLGLSLIFFGYARYLRTRLRQ